MRQDGDRSDGILVFHVDDLHALGVAASDFDFAEGSADNDALLSNDEQVVLRRDCFNSNQGTDFGIKGNRSNAFGATLGQAVTVIVAGAAVFQGDVRIFRIAHLAITLIGQNKEQTAFEGSGGTDDFAAIA